MNVKLVKLSYEYKDLLIEMMDEWTIYNSTHDTNHSPWAIFKNDYHNFDYYLSNLDVINPKEGFVPDSTYFMLDIDDNKFVGAINIRHYLNDSLLLTGGHIGDGIRPSYRNKGYGTKLIKLGLEECKKLGIDKVLVTCYTSNIGSSKCIINNGGVLENEVLEDGQKLSRYWIGNK